VISLSDACIDASKLEKGAFGLRAIIWIDIETLDLRFSSVVLRLGSIRVKMKS